jgi:hypothetical protein
MARGGGFCGWSLPWPGSCGVLPGGRGLAPGPVHKVAGHVVQLDVSALGQLDQQLEGLID